jgi:hypothetical protein
MEKLALFAAAVALLALAALAIRAYLLVKRIHDLVDQVGRLVDSDVGSTVRAWGDTARGVQQAVGKLDDGFGSLATSLDRVDRLTERLEPESLARTVVQPAVAKIASWLVGLRKGLASARERPQREPRTTPGEETEAG